MPNFYSPSGSGGGSFSSNNFFQPRPQQPQQNQNPIMGGGGMGPGPSPDFFQRLMQMMQGLRGMGGHNSSMMNNNPMGNRMGTPFQQGYVGPSQAPFKNPMVDMNNSTFRGHKPGNMSGDILGMGGSASGFMGNGGSSNFFRPISSPMGMTSGIAGGGNFFRPPIQNSPMKTPNTSMPGLMPTTNPYMNQQRQLNTGSNGNVGYRFGM